jgi:hypothetical protein
MMSTSVDTGLNPFNPPVSILAPLLLCMGRGSIFLGPLYAMATSILTVKCTYRSLSAQRLSERTVHTFIKQACVFMKV